MTRSPIELSWTAKKCLPNPDPTPWWELWRCDSRCAKTSGLLALLLSSTIAACADFLFWDFTQDFWLADCPTLRHRPSIIKPRLVGHQCFFSSARIAVVLWIVMLPLHFALIYIFNRFCFVSFVRLSHLWVCQNNLLIKVEPCFQLIGQTMIDKPSNFPKTWTQGPDYWPAWPPITAIAADTNSLKSNNNN